MPRGKARAKPVETQYFSLAEPEDMLAALKEVLKAGYQGAISAHTEPDGKELWGIQLNSPTQQGFATDLGTVILWDGTELRSITAQEFSEMYST